VLVLSAFSQETINRLITTMKRRIRITVDLCKRYRIYLISSLAKTTI